MNSWGPFSEGPETLRAVFGCHNSLCISNHHNVKLLHVQMSETIIFLTTFV